MAAKPPSGRLHQLRFIRLCLAAVRQAGGDPTALIARHCLPPDCEEAETCGVTLPQLRAFADDAAFALDEPNLGLRLGTASPPGTFGIAEYVARTAPSLAEALELTARFATLLSGVARMWVEPAGEERHLHHRIPGEPLALGRHGNEFTLASLLLGARGAGGSALRPVRVWLAHARSEDTAPLEAYFRAPITFGAGENGMAFDAATLASPLQSADPRLQALLRKQAEEQALRADPDAGMAEIVRPEVLRALPRGKVSVESIARALRMSGRTLQRRLAAEGSSFAAVLEEARRTEAHRLLAQPGVSMAEISLLLGYADPSVFVRAFRSWTGRTPSEVRATLLTPSTR